MSRRIVIALLFFLWPGPLPAQIPITIGSQNTLHYGWGSTSPARVHLPQGQHKIQEIWDNTIADNAIGLLQEVMRHAPIGQFAGCVPGHCLVFTSNLHGLGHYREAYVFFASPQLGALGMLECVPLFGALDCGHFSRPPATLIVLPPNHGFFGVMNFHAIWGNTQAGRIAEADQIGNLVADLVVHWGAPVIVGGDWNLDALTVENTIGCLHPCVAPDGLTTVNLQGLLSSSYDHFLWTHHFNNPGAGVLVPLNPLNWRQTVSDHLGVEGDWELP